MNKLIKFFKRLVKLFSKSADVWSKNDPWTLSAAISYYAIISLPGLLVIIISVAGYFYGEQEIQGEIKNQFDNLIGSESARQVAGMIEQARLGSDSVWATILGIGALIFSATGVFAQLQRALNQLWGIKILPKKAIIKLLLTRLFSLGMILVLGFLMMVSLIISSLIFFFSDLISDYLGQAGTYLFEAINVTFSLVVVATVFALIFKVLPDAKISWKKIWVGAFLTSGLFNLGKYLIGYYIGQSDPGSTYGAAGSVILILIWVAYSSLILLFGAAFTRVLAERKGEVIKTSDYAEKVNEVQIKPEDLK